MFRGTWAVVAMAVLLLLASAHADLYVHNPRGSNNRLNERSANRANGNRMFDSQNNNRGGYNVGDKSDEAFNGGDPVRPISVMMNPDDLSAQQYSLTYYEGSHLSIEWTNQHGCGGNEEDDPHKLNCNMVLQYMCDTDSGSGNVAYSNQAMRVGLFDGGNTNTPDEPNNYADSVSPNGGTVTSNRNNERGRQESEAYYYECKKRQRNKGLFTADQNLRGETAKYTRQNPGGTRRGLECPEERDYYPYWSPSPWKDIAYLTDNPERDCPMVMAGSQNRNTVYKCVGPETTNTNEIAITQAECTTQGGTWTAFNKGMSAAEDVYCGQADWSRVNHLGNGRNGRPNMYNWTLPTISQLQAAGVATETNSMGTFARCVFRMRYNISTDDYDPWNTNSSYNDNPNAGIASPVQQNPTLNSGVKMQGLRLAVNTAQFGRTFQDRSHIFFVRQRPTAIPVATNLWNLNVRGKRGNIVQTYPAVEYDFIPNQMIVEDGDWIHVQWTGSNTHNNGAPAGDGQQGDDGEGRGGTDRNNWVEMRPVPGSANLNYPIPLDGTMYTPVLSKAGAQCRAHTAANTLSTLGFADCSIALATSGQWWSISDAENDPEDFNPTLDTAPASLVGGILLRLPEGQYDYMCTRNNNFSNRSQKGTIDVCNCQRSPVLARCQGFCAAR